MGTSMELQRWDIHDEEHHETKSSLLAGPAWPAKQPAPAAGPLWRACALCSTALAVLALVLSIAALAITSLSARTHMQPAAVAQTQQPAAQPPRFVQRVAFGSCSAYDGRPQTVWTQGVIPFQPDAWLWLGDLAYADVPLVDCYLAPEDPACRCNATYLRTPPSSCFAGDLDHARRRFALQLSEPHYRAFLDFMCPPPPAPGSDGSPPSSGSSSSSSSSSGSPGLPRGLYPRAGTDPSQCPRLVTGVWDDHDSGGNNGNRRMPHHDQFKSLFLDALGEPQGSPRRGALRGLEWAHTLNQGDPQGRTIDVVLLDGRYYREPLPCRKRRDWCRYVLDDPDAGPEHRGYAWCLDFLEGDGSPGATGSCCARDDALYAWCDVQPMAVRRQHPLWRAACDPTSSEYGTRHLALRPRASGASGAPEAGSMDLVEVSEADWDNPIGLWPWLNADSPICDVLGMQQRAWLGQVLAESTAPLKLIALGSVPMGAVGYPGDPVPDSEPNGVSPGPCSGDDLGCYPGAQVNFLHQAANASTGCVVLLTGDYHIGDLKVAHPGTGHLYAEILRTQGLRQPVYQVMASGLSTSTAKHSDEPMCGQWMEDIVGLRPLGSCSFVPQPHFGAVEVDWAGRVVTLSLRDARGGGVATGLDGKQQQLRFSLDTCQPLP